MTIYGSSARLPSANDVLLYGYPLVEIEDEQPFIPETEYGQRLPGNIRLVMYYADAQYDLLESTLTVYPVSGALVANDLAIEHPFTVTFASDAPDYLGCSLPEVQVGEGQDALGGYREHFEIYVDAPATISQDEHVYCAAGGFVMIQPVEENYSGRNSLDCDVLTGRPLDGAVGWLPPCNEGGFGLMTIVIDQAP